VYGKNITFDYCTFEPSAKSTPPVTFNQGYQYGIDQRSWAPLTVDHSDFWGWANGIQIGHSSVSFPVTVRNSWFHDARDNGGIDHTDAILENYGNESYITIDHNTIVSKANVNGLALQGDSYSNITVTNNYFSGFGYTVCNGRYGANSNYVFTDNTFGTDIKPYYGPLYPGWDDGNGNLWRRNKWKVVPGGYSTNTADDGKYWTPSGISSTDWTR
jgi:hypothetical protein